MNDIKIFSIGKIKNNDEMVCIKLDAKYSDGLKGLSEYSHVQVLWWQMAVITSQIEVF